MQHFIIDQMPSTNQWAKTQMRAHTIPFSIQTLFQTEGKGQMHKTWESNKGENLLFSLLVDSSHVEIEHQFSISKTVAVSIVAYLTSLGIEHLSIKWPNDIYYKNKKLAGILIENILNSKGIEASVIGIGLNVNQMEFPEHLPNPVSIQQITGKEHRPEAIKEGLSEQIVKNIEKRTAFDESYLNLLFKRGELFYFREKATQQERSGILEGVASNGFLKVKDPSENSYNYFDNNQIEFIL